jgi:phasin family protein
MADDAEAKTDTELKADAAAVKAYAAAAETPVATKAEPAVIEPAVAEPVPAPIAVEPKVAPKAAKIKAAPAPKPVKLAAAPAKAEIKTPKAKPVAAKLTSVKKPAAKAPVKAPLKLAPKPAAAKIKPALKLPKLPKITASIPASNIASNIKESIMSKTTSTVEAVTTKIKDAFTDAQDKAKAAFEKSSASMTEVGAFAKGNVEALVESGKLISTGAQELGKGYVEEVKAGFETLTADVKELAAAKSPTDFFKLQGEIARRSLDTAVAQSSKNAEAMMKLVNEAFAPLSSRINLAVEKINKAA